MEYPALLLASICAATLAATSSAAAQGASLQGIVTDASSGQPIVGALIGLQSGTAEARTTLTDRNGYYQIGGIAPGGYTLTIDVIGYARYEAAVAFAPGERVTESVELAVAAVALEEISVAVAAPEGAARRVLGRQRITPGDIRRAPVPAGSGDLANYLQTLPGVVTTGDRGGQLFIRGGAPAENLSILDGMVIYRPFHIVGFFSAFPEDLVSTVDFYAGGFGARYTGRTSAVLDVQMRDGNRSEHAGVGTVSPFVAEALAEGPIGGGTGSWIVAGRRSLIEEMGGLVTGEDQPLRFESQFVKLSSFIEGGSRCSATGMRTADSGRMDADDPVSRVSWNNFLIGGRCAVLFESFLRLLEVTFSYSSGENAAVTRGASNLTSRVSRLSNEAHTTNLLGPYPIYAGYHIAFENIEYDLTELFAAQRFDGSVVNLSAYGEISIPIGDRAEVRPGVVLHGKPTAGADGRFRARWSPLGDGGPEIQGALGMYRQDVTGLYDQRDVSSVFTAWAEPYRGGAQKSYHAILGVQDDLGAGVSWSLEGYYKAQRNIPVPVWRASVEYATALTRGDGQVRGADARLELRRPGLYGYVGYGYSRTEYEVFQETFEEWYGDPVQRYPPPHDRRHQLNALLSVDLAGMTAGVRWQLGTGLPFTRPIGFDEAFNFQHLLQDVRQRGLTRMVVERPFQGRLPAMHRLDVSLRREFETRFGTLEAQAGAINVYDRPNIFFYDLQTNRRVDQLPLVPYVSLRLEAPWGA